MSIGTTYLFKNKAQESYKLRLDQNATHTRTSHPHTTDINRR